MEDFFLIGVSIFALFPVLYLVTYAAPSYLGLALAALVLIPTAAALINGAPFVPTPMLAVKKMVELAKIKKGEKVYDIGCGDGRTVYLACKLFQANGIGFELSPMVYLIAMVRKFFWKSKAKIVFGNFKFHNLKDADVVFCYLMPNTLQLLQDKLEKELKPGTRVITYAFKIATWKIDHHEPSIPNSNIASIYVYKR